MKQITILAIILGLLSCNKQSDKIQILQNRIDSLETKIANSYKPGFGELMSNVQSHHLKLWFAGISENWKLAEFEIKELKEINADILKYQTEREESQMIEMIYPELDSVSFAINQKNINLFKHSYTLLTNSCNNCHLTTNFEYNVVKIPETSPFTNQDFNSKR